jgi:hypothetical protein
MAADGEALLGQALAPGEVIDLEVVDHLLACRRAQVHICGPDDPALDRVAVIDGG